MQFSGGRRKKLKLAGDQRNACYPHSLQFYLQPPSENISLIEFETLAIDRVKCEWCWDEKVYILEHRTYFIEKSADIIFPSCGHYSTSI